MPNHGLAQPGPERKPPPMHDRTRQVAVIFLSQRTGEDEAGYAAAAVTMDALAAQQAGYCGIDSARGPDGFGITVSWWADEAAAVAWRMHPEHAAIRERGRAVWYAQYEVAVTQVERAYSWERG